MIPYPPPQTHSYMQTFTYVPMHADSAIALVHRPYHSHSDCCFYVYCVNVHFHRKKHRTRRSRLEAAALPPPPHPRPF